MSKEEKEDLATNLQRLETAMADASRIEITEDLLARHRSGELEEDELLALEAASLESPELAERLLEGNSPKDPEISDFEVEASWRRFRDAHPDLGDRDDVPSPSPAPFRVFGSPALRLAAVLLLGAGLGILVLQLAKAPGDAPEPLVNLEVVELTPAPATGAGGVDLEEIVRGDGDGARVHPGASTRGLLLSLASPSAEIFPRHRLEIRRPDGTLVWKTETIQPSQSGAFQVAVPLSLLPSPGSYRLELLGFPSASADSEGRRIATYRLELDDTAR